MKLSRNIVRFSALTLAAVLLLMGNGCAWENIPDEGFIKPFSVRLTMEVAGSIDPSLYYFMVFNFSGENDQRPEPEFEGEDRGLYWDAYYMYGNPIYGSGYDFYRQVGGATKNGVPRLDLRPIPSKSMSEFVTTSVPSPGVSPSGNRLKLELDFGAPLEDLFVEPPTYINMNMMVASLPFDRVNNPDDPFDALIYDSFNWKSLGAVTLNIGSSETDFNEQEFPAEEEENIGENPPHNANITSWRLEII